MSTASTASREGSEQARGNASAEDLQKDLQALRGDLRRLAEQVAGIVAGSAAWQRARSTIESTMDEAVSEDFRREAAKAVREVSDHFVEAIDESIKTRPYTTLALVAGAAFLFGAMWRR